jgi:hypothetical protein
LHTKFWSFDRAFNRSWRRVTVSGGRA